MSIRVLIRESPNRSVALATDAHVLIFRYSPAYSSQSEPPSRNTSQSNLHHNGNNSGGAGNSPARCIVEFSAVDTVDLSDYRSLSSMNVHGTLD